MPENHSRIFCLRVPYLIRYTPNGLFQPLFVPTPILAVISKCLLLMSAMTLVKMKVKTDDKVKSLENTVANKLVLLNALGFMDNRVG